MLQNFLEGVNYYDFPSLEVAVFSLMLAFTLSSSIALTYHFTFQGSNFPNYFFQAIVLSSIVTSMIIMSVGNNLAVGFGIIGAVAIIRFRTVISDPRKIIFMDKAIYIFIKLCENTKLSYIFYFSFDCLIFLIFIKNIFPWVRFSLLNTKAYSFLIFVNF